MLDGDMLPSCKKSTKSEMSDKILALAYEVPFCVQTYAHTHDNGGIHRLVTPVISQQCPEPHKRNNTCGNFGRYDVRDSVFPLGAIEFVAQHRMNGLHVTSDSPVMIANHITHSQIHSR